MLYEVFLAPMIIVRYITKEVLSTFLAISLILLLIALSNRFAIYLAKAATGELPVGLVVRLVLLYTPELLSFLIPLSFFIAILFTYGRLHADSEMTVLFACGFSWSYISKLTLFLATIIMIINAFLSLWLVPVMTHYREKAASEGEALAVINSLLPGRFQMFDEGHMVFYLEDIDPKDKHLKGIFIAEQPTNNQNETNPWTLITAKEAHTERAEETKNFYLVLNDGYRYQGRPGSTDYTIVKFKEYGRSVQQEASLVPETQKLKTTDALFKSNLKDDAAELQWRLAIPLSVPILALLAIPLARVNPRHGRFAKFLPAIILYIFYYNLFTLSKRWVANQVIPEWIGLWWVHIIFLTIALLLLGYESGWFREILYKKKTSNGKKQISASNN